MAMEMQKPVPYPSPETQPFWDGCKRHELTLPYCTKCAAFFFYPRQFCPKCFSWEIEWRPCSGKGTLFTFAIQFRAQMPGFTPPSRRGHAADVSAGELVSISACQPCANRTCGGDSETDA